MKQSNGIYLSELILFYQKPSKSAHRANLHLQSFTEMCVCEMWKWEIKSSCFHFHSKKSCGVWSAECGSECGSECLDQILIRVWIREFYTLFVWKCGSVVRLMMTNFIRKRIGPQLKRRILLKNHQQKKLCCHLKSAIVVLPKLSICSVVANVSDCFKVLQSLPKACSTVNRCKCVCVSCGSATTR